jgi:hypothetical protein
VRPVRTDQSVFKRSMPSDLIQVGRPVRVKKKRQIKNLEPRFDSIETGFLERDEIRLGPFFSCPGRSAAGVLRGPLYFAWGCFRDFLSRPCLAPPKGRYAMPGPGHEIVSASRLRDESIQLQHIML